MEVIQFIVCTALLLLLGSNWKSFMKSAYKRRGDFVELLQPEQLQPEACIEIRPCLETVEFERRRNTRKMVLAGMFFLNATEDRVASTVVNGKTLSEFLTREEDRELFELK